MATTGSVKKRRGSKLATDGHTPGPWRALTGGGKPSVWSKSGCVCILTTRAALGATRAARTKEQAIADAKLIASLPHLLKELDAAKHDIERLYTSLNSEMNARIEAERELAELRAQQPPREPTPEMIAAVTSRPIQVVQTHHLYGIWRAMYDAAPPAQQPKAE